MGAEREAEVCMPGCVCLHLAFRLLVSFVCWVGFSVAIPDAGVTARSRVRRWERIVAARRRSAVLVRSRRTSRYVHALPDARRRLRLLTRLREMREAGEDRSACMHFLRRRGLRPEVAQGLLVDLERQQVADCERVLEGSWNGYAFRYPGNWRVRPLFEEAGPEAGISIQGFGSALLVLVHADAECPGYAELVAEQEALIRHPQRASISTWGSLRGRGALLSGPDARLKLLIEVQVFRPHDVPRPFCLVQFHAVEEEPLVRPGFELVQSTLAIANSQAKTDRAPYSSSRRMRKPVWGLARSQRRLPWSEDKTLPCA